MSGRETYAFLVTGMGGRLAKDVVDVARPLGQTVFCRGLTAAELDLTDPFAVKDTVAEWCRVVRADSPDHRVVVVNAACTAAGYAEADEEAAYAVNAVAPALLAQACAAHGARLLHVSTGEVFAGDRPGGPPYDVGDEPAPGSAYGRTRLAGELAVRTLLPQASWVVRTGWGYGVHGDSFVKAVARLAREQDVLQVADQGRGSPTWSRDVARGLWALAREQPPAGTYHCTNGGDTTWLGFARAVLEELGVDPARAVPAPADAPAGALSPPAAGALSPPAAGALSPPAAYAVLSPRSWDEAGLPRLPDWREALAAAFRLHGSALSR